MNMSKGNASGRSKWLISSTSVILTVAVMEIVLRFMGYGNVETYVPDQNLIWRLKPNQDTYTKYGGKIVHINSAGLRDREFAAEKQEHTYRVIVLGNSCTYGWGVGQDEMYSKLLEKKLNGSSKNQKYEIINGGVIGYSIAQELEYLKADGLVWHPDMILISHTFNEGKRVNPGSPQDVKDKVFTSLQIKNVLRNIALYHYVVEHNFSHQYVRLAKKITEDPTWIEDSAFDLYQKNLQEIIDICQAHSIQVSFLITVTKNQILDDSVVYSKHQSAMRAIAEKNQIPAVSFMDVFRQNRSQELYVDGGHPNEFGHELMANEIIAKLFVTSDSTVKEK